MSFKKELQEVKSNFPDLNLDNLEKAKIAVNIYNIYKHHNIDVNKKIISFAINSDFEPSNYNDYYYLATVAYLKTEGIKKIAYPVGQGALEGELPEEFDLEKWSSLVHRIYDAVSKKEMSYDNAVDFYSGYLDPSTEEDKKFKEWIKYYKNGEHLKYNVTAGKRDNMEKKADFQFPLSGSGFYPSQSVLPSRDKKEIDVNKKETKDAFNEWKQKLYVAIRRLDKLLRQGDPHMNADVHADLADLLHAFDMEVRKVRTAATASDMTIRTANTLERNGFKKEAGELIKLAQEAPVAPPVEAPIEDVSPPEELATEPAVPEDQPETSEKDEGLGTVLRGGTGPRPGEYEALSGEVTLEIASAKLEEIAGRLADRRVVRLLAEFDIMLDKLGVAPMFPELAEAQSKLIDSYSYALTRVTKMLGMLSSGKSIAEISGAKEDEMQRSLDKEVAKTFSPPAEEKQKGTEAISEEFGEAKPVGGEDAAQPAPAPIPTEEV